MKEITIEWKHYDKAGETCKRCNDTGSNIQKAIEEISKNPLYKNVKIAYKETKLKADKMPESNSVLVNEQPIENILNAKTSQNHCHSCSCLSGKATDCRTIEIDDKTLEVIPVELIKEATIKTIETAQ